MKYWLRPERGRRRITQRKRATHRCAYCGCRFTGDGERRSTLDHRIPKSRGGKGGANLVPACLSCNQKKADQIWPVKY